MGKALSLWMSRLWSIKKMKPKRCGKNRNEKSFHEWKRDSFEVHQQRHGAWKKVGLFYSTGRGPKGSKGNAINLTHSWGDTLWKCHLFLRLKDFWEKFRKLVTGHLKTKTNKKFLSNSTCYKNSSWCYWNSFRFLQIPWFYTHENPCKKLKEIPWHQKETKLHFKKRQNLLMFKTLPKPYFKHCGRDSAIS